MITAQDIDIAYDSIKDNIIKTPLIPALTLSRMYGIELYLKLENLQLTGSFKARGALHKLNQLNEQERANGVIACSAGNHAQGVAYKAQKMGIKATIVMPENTPAKKIQNTQNYGADVILKGETFADAMAYCKQMASEQNLTFISPYDDEDIIAGQGTIGKEIIEEMDDIDAVVAPVGGGGLISGISTYIKGLKPNIKVISAEVTGYASAYNMFRENTYPPQKTTIAEGIAVKDIGDITRDYIAKYVDDFLVVDEDSTEEAVYDFITHEKIVAEGAAGAGLAAIINNAERFKGQKVVLVVCGGNIDSGHLTHILTRGLFRSGIYATLRFETEDRPGVLAHISKHIAQTGASIVEVKHNRLFRHLSAKKAFMDITLETRGAKHLDEIKTALSNEEINFKVIDF